MKLELGPIIVTPWVSLADDTHAVGCPLCRNWSVVDPQSVGKELPCPRCSGRLKLNPFTVKADWRQVASGWAPLAPPAMS